jgi:hypothetical protein
MKVSSINRRRGIIGLAALLVVGGLAVTTSSAAGPDPGVTVTCKPDKLECKTGKLKGPKGGVANLEVADADTATATLSALFTAPTYNCTGRGYTATSDQFVFDIKDFSAPAPDSLVKTVTFSSPIGSGSKKAADYEACFAAPYKFPALDLRPGQFPKDRKTGNFSDNTDPVADIGSGVPGFAGILPLCAAQITANTAAGELHAPCVATRSVDTIAGTVTIVIQVPAADPGMRF